LGAFFELRQIGLDLFAGEPFPIDQIELQGTEAPARTFRLTQQQELSTCVVSRTVFDQAIFDYALTCGTEYRVINSKGPLWDGSQVIGVSGTAAGRTVQVQSKIVIGADGATSAIARSLGRRLRRDDQWAVALRGYVDTEPELENTIELAFLDHLQPGYAWFFPVSRRRANVGVGMRSDFYKRQHRSLNKLLTDYLALAQNKRRIGGNRVEEVQSWPVPLFTFDRQRVFDGALLAGDAGGFVHPITAAGIHPAIITGRCAAEAVCHALARGDLSQAGLAQYDQLWRTELAADFQPAVTASKIATAFPHLIAAALLRSPPKGEPHSDIATALPFAAGKF
jgi:flavin-dependent dehydrogenase